MTETETTPTPTMGDSNEAAQIGQRAQQLIEEIDNFLKTTGNRHNIPATEIQDHLLDIRRLAIPDNTIAEQN
jgi:hypothetical protein